MISSANDIQIRELKDSLLELKKLVEAQQATITALSTERAELQNERNILKEQVDYLKKKLFGKKSVSDLFSGVSHSPMHSHYNDDDAGCR